MIIDAHLHCTGRETTRDVLRALDDAGIDQAVLLAPFLDEGYALDDPPSLRRANDHLAQLVRGHGDRLIGFAVVNPSDPGAADELRRAIETLGLAGAKMVPSGWFPSDARVQPVFAVAASLQLPLLFHSGIFIDGRSGRFCRPCEFEVLRDHPGVRVALAHLGWPWTDEAIAVGLIDRIHGVPPADAVFRFDISFGPPPPYRLEVLRRALDVLGPTSLQFGSDCFLPCSGQHIAERRGWVDDLMDQLELDAPTRQQIYAGTAATWLRRPASAPHPRHAQPQAQGEGEGEGEREREREAQGQGQAQGQARGPDAPSGASLPPAAPATLPGRAGATRVQSPAGGLLRRGWLGAGGPMGRMCC